MFTYPAKELFNQNGERRVVWSQEQFEEALANGWSENPFTPSLDPPEPKKLHLKAK